MSVQIKLESTYTSHASYRCCHLVNDTIEAAYSCTYVAERRSRRWP